MPLALVVVVGLFALAVGLHTVRRRMVGESVFAPPRAPLLSGAALVAVMVVAWLAAVVS